MYAGVGAGLVVTISLRACEVIAWNDVSIDRPVALVLSFSVAGFPRVMKLLVCQIIGLKRGSSSIPSVQDDGLYEAALLLFRGESVQEVIDSDDTVPSRVSGA